MELLSPVGDFDCLKAAVQNGADAVYFGANSFSARAFASNFDDDTLAKAINYAKIRGVKTNLTLNTLIKNDEMYNAIALAKKAYEYGIDAIIVQDLGLARYMIKNFPGLAVHASTQMSVHNLEGVLTLQNMGFSRVVLSRELSLQEIDHICKNSNVEIEAFVHCALCISYSGQCLFSSMVGGRSGNRGKCAQPCRLPYELLENDTTIDKGYLLSPRDLCGLEYLPQLVNAGVTCLKIEGRMKTPEYVATVTRIYRKYLDLAMSKHDFKIDEKDKKDLLQVFNRGGFSNGHLSSTENRKLIYPQKSNNMGIYLGTISNFNKNHGHISFTTNEILHIGDKICVENKKHETNLYTISELMKNDKNITVAHIGDKIKIGRMKGDIFIGDKLFKISDKELTTSALETIEKESRKRKLSCEMKVILNSPISLKIFDDNISVKIDSNIIPEPAQKSPMTKERLISQICKTNNTPYNFENINIELGENLYVPSISGINELRRQALAQYEEKLISSFRRLSNANYTEINQTSSHKEAKISLLLNTLNLNYDYLELKNISKIYIPFKYFINKDFSHLLLDVCKKFDAYIYMPTIIRNNYNRLIKNNLPTILEKYKIKGFVLSNIGNFELLKDYKDYEFICNYTFNIFNNLTINELPANTITLSPELNKTDLENFNTNKKTELIVYGRTPLMNSNYCLLGKSNKCYLECEHKCNSTNKYYLKDRLGFLFRIIPDNIQTITTIYNSKITSIEYDGLPIDFARIDILDESISEINDIIKTVLTGKKLEGNQYTNGNFNKEI